MKRFLRQFRYGEKGFTLIELLVVIAVLGVLAAVVVPNVGKFIGQGKDEAWATELHNIQTAVMALMADSDAGVLDAAGCTASQTTPTADMATITADGTKLLSDYLTGLDVTSVTSGCTYAFLTDGTVTQTTPTP